MEVWHWHGNSLVDSNGNVLLECTQKPDPKIAHLVASTPLLLDACKSALLLSDEEGNLPDNGEFSGAIIGDQINYAVEIAQNG